MDYRGDRGGCTTLWRDNSCLPIFQRKIWLKLCHFCQEKKGLYRWSGWGKLTRTKRILLHHLEKYNKFLFFDQWSITGDSFSLHPCHRTLDWFHEETKLCKLTRCGQGLNDIDSLSPAPSSAVIMGTGVALVICLIPNTLMLLTSSVRLNLLDLCVCFSIAFLVVVQGKPCVSTSFRLLSALTRQARMQFRSIPIK